MGSSQTRNGLTPAGIGCAVGDLREGPVAGRLRELPPLGIEFIEPLFPSSVGTDGLNHGLIADTQKVLVETGLRVWSVHTPFGRDVDISSPARDVRERGIVAIKRALEGCAALGGNVAVVHLSDVLDDGDRHERLRIATDTVERVVEAAVRYDVRIAIENLPPRYLGAQIDELMSVVECYPVDRVGLCFDTGHAHMCGSAAEFTAVAANRLITMHLHDNDGIGDQHLVPGYGSIDWDAAGRALFRSGYEGPLMFEVKGPGSPMDSFALLREADAMIRSNMKSRNR